MGTCERLGKEFAVLLGVACKGTCYAEASRWSTVAIKYGNRGVLDWQTCRGFAKRERVVGLPVLFMGLPKAMYAAFLDEDYASLYTVNQFLQTVLGQFSA